MEQQRETPAFKISLIVLSVIANVLLTLVVTMLFALQTQQQKLQQDYNEFKVTVATEYVRQDQLREIVSGVVQGMQQQPH